MNFLKSFKNIFAGPIFNFDLRENFTAADVIEAFPTALSGRWHPPGCRGKFRLAVLVPFRDRGAQNYTFLMNMHKYFQMHNYEYGIFFIEQVIMLHRTFSLNVFRYLSIFLD